MVKWSLILIVSIILLILSITLFVKRKKIIDKYNIGYISSFFFAAYMVTPLTIGISFLFGQNNDNQMMLGIMMSVIYPIISIIKFMIKNRKHSFQYRLGKLLAILGLGICSAFILVFMMLSFFYHFEKYRRTITITK